MFNYTTILEPERAVTISAPEAGEVIITRLSNSPGDVLQGRTTPFKSINLANDCSIKLGPFTQAQRYTISSQVELTNPVIETENVVYNRSTTGILSGGYMSVASTSTFNISSGQGIVVDNYTDPDFPKVVKVIWPERTGIAVENLSSIVSFVGIDIGGNVVQFDEITLDANTTRS